MFTVADVPGSGARREQWPRARPGVPAPRRAVLGARARRRLRDRRSRPRPASATSRRSRPSSRRTTSWSTAASPARPRLVALNKVDVPDARDLAELVRGEVAERFGFPVFEISAAIARRAARARLRDGRAGARQPGPPPATPSRPGSCCVPRRPATRASASSRSASRSSSCTASGRGAGCGQTDFTNDEAVGYLADRLARLGVEDALARLGARAGAEVTIGDVTFDWEPTLRSRCRRRRTAAAAPTPGSSRTTGSARTSARPRARRAVGVRREVEAATARQLGRLRRARRSRRPSDGERRLHDRRRRAHEPRRRRDARRLVVKVGSSSLASSRTAASTRRASTRLSMRSPSGCASGSQVVLVSSGAIAAGLKPLGLAARPRDLATQQAAASVGQGMLLARYSAAFARHGLHRRAGAADGRRRRATCALPQRARTFDRLLGARRRAGRQRERHRRHRGDPVRRQRPARGAGHPPRPRRRVDPALRRRRRVRRRPRARLPPRGSPTCTATATWRTCGSARSVRPGSARGGMATKVAAARIAAGAGVPTLLGARRSGRRRPWPAPTSGRAFTRPGGGAGAAAVARARDDRAGALRLDPGAVRGGRRPARRCSPPASPRVEGEFAAGDPIDLLDDGGVVVAPRPRRLRRRGAAGAAGPLDPRARRDPRLGVLPRSRPPRRPRPALNLSDGFAPSGHDRSRSPLDADGLRDRPGARRSVGLGLG